MSHNPVRYKSVPVIYKFLGYNEYVCIHTNEYIRARRVGKCFVNGLTMLDIYVYHLPSANTRAIRVSII